MCIVKDALAVAYLAYKNGDSEAAIRSFVQSCEQAKAAGDQGLQQVIEFFSPPVAAIQGVGIPASDNTLAPSLHSQSNSLLEDGDEEMESRAEAEDDIDDDSEVNDSDDEDEDEEEDDSGFSLSISSSTPIRLKEK